MHGDRSKGAGGKPLKYETVSQMARNLETSRCVIGLQNPRYRISDESFCREPLDRSLKMPAMYSLNTVVDYFIFGISN